MTDPAGRERYSAEVAHYNGFAVESCLPCLSASQLRLDLLAVPSLQMKVLPLQCETPPFRPEQG